MVFETILLSQMVMCIVMDIPDCPESKIVSMENEWTPAYYYYSDGIGNIHYDNDQTIHMGIIVHELSHHVAVTQHKDFSTVCKKFGGTNCYHEH